MTRGKYAARAANARAETAADRTERLEKLLAEERAAHAREVAEFKTRVEQLNGKLTREVDAIAKTEVTRVKEASAAENQALREAMYQRSLEVFRCVARCGLKVGDGTQVLFATEGEERDLFAELIEVLKVNPGDAWKAVGEAEGASLSRFKRRETSAEHQLITRNITPSVIRHPRRERGM